MIPVNRANFANEVMIILDRVAYNTTEQMLSILHEFIDTYTYEFGGSNVQYLTSNGGNPSYEFKEAFKSEFLSSVNRQVNFQIYYDWQSMSTSNEDYMHVSWGESTLYKDMREYLVDILNVNGSAGNDSKQRRAYLDLFLQSMETKFKEIVRKNFTLLGIKVI